MDLNNGVSESTKSKMIDEIVNESIKANSVPHRPSSSSIGRPIRAGGRPRKGGAPNKATLRMIAAEFEEAKTTPPPPPPHAEAAGPAPETFSEDPALKPDDIPEVALIAVLQMPFDVLRAKTGFEGYRLPEEQARSLTPLLKAVIEIYLPNVPSKHAPAIILAGTLGSILWREYGEHQAFMRATHVNATVADHPNAPAPAPAVFHPSVSQ